MIKQRNGIWGVALIALSLRGEKLTVTFPRLISSDRKRCGLRRKGAGYHPRLDDAPTPVRHKFKVQVLSIHRPPTDILWTCGTVMTGLLRIHNSLPIIISHPFRSTIMFAAASKIIGRECLCFWKYDDEITSEATFSQKRGNKKRQSRLSLKKKKLSKSKTEVWILCC